MSKVKWQKLFFFTKGENIMKKTKLLPSILMLIMCVSVLAVGIFAVSPAQNNVTGTISVIASNVEFEITAYLDSISGTKISDTVTARTSTPIALYNNVLKFDGSNASSVDSVDDIIVVLQIKNNSASKALGAFFLKDDELPTTLARENIASTFTFDGSSADGTSTADDLIKARVQDYTQISAGATVEVICTFSLNTLVEADMNVSFTLPLVLHDYDETLVGGDVNYYTSIADALTAINNSTYEDNTLTTLEQASAGLTVENEMPKLVLTKDTTLASALTLSKDMTFDLDGNTLNFTSATGFNVTAGNVTIDGSDAGSKLSIANTTSTTGVNVTGGTCTLKGGEYRADSAGPGTDTAPNALAIVASGAKLEAKNAEINVYDTTTGTIGGIWVKEGGQANISNTNVFASGVDGLYVSALFNYGACVANNSDFIGFANHKANAAGTNYASTSNGIKNFGTLTLKNCDIKGIHSGMTNKGTLYVDGGTFEGYSHGGIYFGNVTQPAYVKNATLYENESMPEGCVDDGIAGSNHAGFYIGGGDGIVVYMDNCSITGKLYPFVIRASGFEEGNTLYISNSNIGDFEKYIRIDNKSHKLYIGIGCNFVTDTAYYEEAVHETTEDYGTMFPEY